MLAPAQHIKTVSNSSPVDPPPLTQQCLAAPSPTGHNGDFARGIVSRVIYSHLHGTIHVILGHFGDHIGNLLDLGNHHVNHHSKRPLPPYHLNTVDARDIVKVGLQGRRASWRIGIDSQHVKAVLVASRARSSLGLLSSHRQKSEQSWPIRLRPLIHPEHWRFQKQIQISLAKPHLSISILFITATKFIP